MQSTSEGYFDVVDLAKELRSEKLFIQSELEILRQLNEKLEKSALELAQAKWTSTQQRSNLKQLFAQGDVTSSSCVPRTDYVLSPVFVDAHKVLRYQDALVLSELIQRVRASPAVASLWLTAAESRRPREAGAAARALCSGLYTGGGSGAPRDVAPLRKVLRHLAAHRLATAEDPRRIIGQGSSSFSRLYLELVEGFRPARLFLSAALRGPFLPLLQLDECLLVDPDKAMDRIKKFCTSAGSSTDCEAKLARYRKWTLTSLAAAANRFIASLTENWACFPPSVAWVVRQTALILRATRRIPEADIHSICTDLVFTNFICQAIANPEAYGITDIPITNVGRFNLAQVAQTLQMLCLMKHQEVDRKLQDLYSRFEKDSVYSLLDAIVDDETFSAVSDDGQQFSDVEEEILEGAVCEEQDMDLPKTEPIVNANVALFTRTDLQLLVSLLKKIPLTITNGFDSSPEQIINSTSSSSNLEQDFKELSMYDKNSTPGQSSDSIKPKNNVNGVIKNVPPEGGDHRDNIGETDIACGVTEDSNGGGAGDNGIELAELLPHDEGLNQLLRCIHPEHMMKLQKLLKRLPDCNFTKESPVQKPPTKGKYDGTNGNTSSPVKNGPKKPSPQSQEVLVIKLPGDTAYEPIGLVSESKVLECHYARSLSADLLVPCTDSEGPLALLVQVPHNAGGGTGAVGSGLGMGAGIGAVSGVTVGSGGNSGEVASSAVEAPGTHPGQEKRTRFSLSHDEGSIGNTSDNLEAVSEAASNHSVTSSLEMETEDQNDNLSDMVSANVSGRGSPNISGRDTPSSQVTEGEAGVGPAMPQAQRHPASVPLSSTAAMKQAKLLKRTRHDIEDKFCKFEIKKLMEGDETISIISDTWSTDVLASDSETIGESYDRVLVTPTMAIGQQNVLAAVVGQQPLPSVQPNQPDVSETASESAWSTDALVSDSDRMTEVDMDECNSIARSDTGTVRSDGEPLPPVLQHPAVPQPHHQFSPLNNINRDALLNRRQMCAASSVHTAHPDNNPNMLNNILNGGLAINSNRGNASSEESPEDLIMLRSPSTRNANISPSSFMIAGNSVSNSNGLENNEVTVRNKNGHGENPFAVRNHSRELSRRPLGYHGRVSDVLNDASTYVDSNGTLMKRYPRASSCFSSRTVPDLQAGPSHAPCLDSPLSALDSPGQPAFYQDYRENHTRPNLNMNVFDFSQQNDGMAETVNHHSILEPEVSTPDGMFHSEGSAFVEASSSGSATSRWLNDPIQKFPARSHADSSDTPSSSSPVNDASCSNHETQKQLGTSVSALRNSMNKSKHNNISSNIASNTNGSHNGMVITNLESVFRPIQVERDNLNNGNDHIDLYCNDMQASSNRTNSINGFEDHFVDLPQDQYEIRSNNADLDYDNSTQNVRMHSSVMSTQHSFTSSNLVANSISRVSKTTESRTSIINISSSRIEKSKENKPTESSENNGCISSGSAMSLSTLSVNSADTSTSDRSSSQDVNSENLTERRVSPSPLNKVTILSSGDVKMHRIESSGMGISNTLPRNSTIQAGAGSMKPGASTGAIPKSISFDATAEKSHRYHSGRRAADDSNEGSGLNFGDLKNNMKRSGGNLLNKIKLFRNKSRGFASSASGFGKRNTNQEYNEDLSKTDADCELDGNSVSIVVNREDNLTNSLPTGSAVTQKLNTELSDDILAKYRRKASSSSDAATSDSTSNSGHSATVSGNRSRGASVACDEVGNGSDGESAPDGLSDIASDIEFDSLKRKLRLVLSNMDIHSFEISNSHSGWAALACALRMENGPGALGLLSGIGARRGRAPFSSLRADSNDRTPYAAYLATCRRSLLSAIAATQSEAEWQRGEALRQAALAAAARARVSLAAREPRLAALQEGLRAGLADDKRDTLAATLAALASEMAAEDSWAGASEWELQQAALTVERAVMSRVYLQAMFPNGDGDILRDQLLHDHISRLSLNGVGLPERRLAGAPWTSAQRILTHLPAYKTPSDKVECVVRCVNNIMAMLSMSEGSAPGADDLTPALVYVLIKANPTSLLSTVQFVSTFLSIPLEGEHLYCWTQFCSAVEYIKTMDYAQRTRR